MAIPARPALGRKPIRRGPRKRIVEGKSFRLANEVRYIQRRAPDHASRILTIGQLVLFSTETGDAWRLDPADQLAARLARDGQSETIHIEETDTTFAIGWKGRYRIDGPAFVYSDHTRRKCDQPMNPARTSVKAELIKTPTTTPS